MLTIEHNIFPWYPIQVQSRCAQISYQFHFSQVVHTTLERAPNNMFISVFHLDGVDPQLTR